MTTNNSNDSNSTLTNKLNRALTKKNGLLGLFVALFAAIGVYAILQAGAAPKTTAAVTLSLSPSSGRYQTGQTVGMAVKLNTNGQTVNAVQANLTYPAEKFEFVRIDSAGSAFEVEAESTGAAGSVKIARGTINSITSADALVATVYLRALSAGRKVNVSFADSSMVVRTPDALNILQRRTGGSYTIQ